MNKNKSDQKVRKIDFQKKITLLREEKKANIQKGYFLNNEYVCYKTINIDISTVKTKHYMCKYSKSTLPYCTRYKIICITNFYDNTLNFEYKKK